MHRRTFLKGAGVLTILCAGGQVFRSFGESIPEIGEGPAFEPWKTWCEEANEGTPLLVRAAIISSNAYNSQPWLFKITRSRVELYADLRRNLGAFDPYLREMHFSLGCALENLMLAAAANGYKSSLTYLPGKLATSSINPAPELVARVGLSSGARMVNELYEAIPHRHTNREPFDIQKSLPQNFIEALSATAANEKDVKLFLFTDESTRKRIVEVTVAGTDKLLSDPDVRDSTKAWFRTTRDQMQKLRDGVLVDMDSQTPQSRPLETYTSLMLTGRLFGLIGVRDRYDREQTIRAGRVWQRAHLLATARGQAARPANGAVEIIDHEKRLNLPGQSTAQLAKITGDALWQPTFIFYMGYPTTPAVASPRRAVQDVLL